MRRTSFARLYTLSRRLLVTSAPADMPKEHLKCKVCIIGSGPAAHTAGELREDKTCESELREVTETHSYWRNEIHGKRVRGLWFLTAEWRSGGFSRLPLHDRL